MQVNATDRHGLLIATVILVTLTTSAAVWSKVKPAGDAGGIATSASGSGQTTVAGELRTFSFVAQGGHDGVATGMAQVNNRMVDEKFQLTLDCLKVVGNVAIVSGVFIRHTDTHAVGLTGIFAAQDSGAGASTPDRITQVFFFEPGELRCTDLEPADASPFFVDVEGGNVQVH